MEQKSTLVGITEITQTYLPFSKKKARKFVSLYLEPKKVGNRIYVERSKLEDLLHDPNRTNFPLNI